MVVTNIQPLLVSTTGNGIFYTYLQRFYLYVRILSSFAGYYLYKIIMLATKKKQTVIKKNQVHETDTGSPEVQIAMLSARIEELSTHLKKHKKDNHSRRGLIKMVSDRRTHLRYLEKKDKTRHAEVLKTIKG